MRRVIAFPCAGETLFGTLDEAPGTVGVLIVSGGNEVRMGAHRGMAMLAARIAAELGAPVLRFDRRGVGDSSGANLGYANSAPDIAAAAATFAAEMPGVRRILAFGICDAATALALFHGCAGVDALLLANPWVVEDADPLPPKAAIRARYAGKLSDPREWLRLVTGRVDLRKLAGGLGKLARADAASADSLAARVAKALGDAAIPVTILLCRGDNTAIAFAAAYREADFDAARPRTGIAICESASHSFAGGAEADWLFERVRDALGA